MKTLREWQGPRPSEMGICSPDDDLPYMVAWMRTELDMMAWEHQEAERERKRNK